jgi:hypothetical protein
MPGFTVFGDHSPKGSRPVSLKMKPRKAVIFFGTLYADPAKLKGFLQSMTGLSMGASKAIAQQFPWDEYQTFYDMGSAQGGLVVQVALGHPHITGEGFDLPPTGPIFEEYIRSFRLNERLQFIPVNFFTDPLPKGRGVVYGSYPS